MSKRRLLYVMDVLMTSFVRYDIFLLINKSIIFLIFFSGKGDVPGGVTVEYFFELFPIEETYTMAAASCKAKGGYLASIRDQNDLTKILDLMDK